MTKNLLQFLNELEFSQIQISIYEYLLFHKFGTINDIKNNLNYSYSQVHHNLTILEEKKLIESSIDSYPTLYFRKNPKIALNELTANKYSRIKQQIEKIDETLKAHESQIGICEKEIYRVFYHYSDINLGIENFYTMIGIAEKEIIMTSLPPSLLKKLEPALQDAFTRGIKIELYYSNEDFEEITQYLDLITNILHRIGLIIIETSEKTCQRIRYNNKFVNMGNILVDEDLLNSIIFKDDEVYLIEGFPGNYFVQQAKSRLKNAKTIIKRMEMEYPKQYLDVISIIEQNQSIKTRDLSRKSKISGTILKQILDYLVRTGAIEENFIKGQGAGRPKRVYSIVETN